MQNCCFLWVITLPGNLPKVYFVHLKTISGKRWRRGWGILGNFTRIIASKERSKFGTNIYYCQESFQNPLLCNVLSNTQKKEKKNTSSILFLLKFLVLELPSSSTTLSCSGIAIGSRGEGTCVRGLTCFKIKKLCVCCFVKFYLTDIIIMVPGSRISARARGGENFVEKKFPRKTWKRR